MVTCKSTSQARSKRTTKNDLNFDLTSTSYPCHLPLAATLWSAIYEEELLHQLALLGGEMASEGGIPLRVAGREGWGGGGGGGRGRRGDTSVMQSCYFKFYETNKDFVDGLGKCT